MPTDEPAHELAETTLTDEAQPQEESLVPPTTGSAAESDEPEREDVPRRARTDEEAQASDDEVEPLDDGPVFQKSATPYWTGVTTHVED
jgi:hypothetical protein